MRRILGFSTLLLAFSTINCDCFVEYRVETLDSMGRGNDKYDFDKEGIIKCTNISIYERSSLEAAISNKKENRSILTISDSSIPVLKSSILDDFYNFKKMYFINTSTHDIEANTFANLAVLDELKIVQNDLAKIEDGAFSGTPNLRNLDLSHNELLSLEYINQIPNLNHLNISFNRISRVSEKDLVKFTELDTLDLSSNLIPEIDPNILTKLSKLKFLILQNNSIENFQIANYAQNLNLSDNLLETIDIDLNGTNELTSLDLSRNRLKVLKERQFKDLNLKILILDGNFIYEIDSNAFKNLNNLLHLSLSNNDLSNLYFGTFRFLTSLTYLSLSGNRFESFKYGTFSGLDNLLHLDLSNNRLQILDLKAFYSMRNLNEFMLHGNFLDNFEVDEIKYHFSSLQKISLGFKNVGCDSLVKIMRRLKDSKLQNGDDVLNHNINGIQCDPDIQEFNINNVREEIIKISTYFNIATIMFIFVVSIAVLILVMKCLYCMNLFSYCRTKFRNWNEEKLLENGAE